MSDILANTPRRVLLRFWLSLGLLLALVLVALWLGGGLVWLETALRAAQRTAQSSLAGGLRALRAGQPGAWVGLIGTCFAYGFLHAAGPGHGKLVVAGYGVAQRVRLWPLVGLALAASIAQALVAVALVLAGVMVLGWGRDQLEWASGQVLTPLGNLMIIGLGLWIMARGLRRGWRALGRTTPEPGPHHHHHDADCGHAHGPDLAQVAALTGWRDAAALVAAIALRPCTGALFVLIITSSMGLVLAGVVGALAMGLGTATVTCLFAALAVWAREGGRVNLPGSSLARVLPLVEVSAGALIVLAAVLLLGTAG